MGKVGRACTGRPMSACDPRNDRGGNGNARARDLPGRRVCAGSAGPGPGRGAAARRRRSRIASPRPRSGTGITAMARNSGRSSARSMANRLAAASKRSPLGLRFSVRAAPGRGGARTRAGLRRRRRWRRPGAAGATARSGWRAGRASAAGRVLEPCRDRRAGRSPPPVLPGVTPPGRSRRGGVQVTSSTVDSTPIGHGPPSTMSSIRSPRAASTWSAVVGLSCPAGWRSAPRPAARSPPAAPARPDGRGAQRQCRRPRSPAATADSPPRAAGPA